MSLMNVNSQSLSRDLGVEVPEMMVVVAKHQVLGMDDESILQVLGASQAELDELTQDPLYKQIRVLVGAAQAQARVNQTAGWDGIEDLAVGRLLERLPFEKDSEFLLRVAAVANKATRRSQPAQQVLNPQDQMGKVAVTLTRRIVEKLNATQAQTVRVEEQQLSITDGSMSRVTFDEVDDLLGVKQGLSGRPQRPSRDEMNDVVDGWLDGNESQPGR